MYKYFSFYFPIGQYVKMLLVYVLYFFLFFNNMADVNAWFCTATTCNDCVKSTFLNLPCTWCNRSFKCHSPASLLNPCKRVENIVEQSHCDDKFSKYDPQLSMKMLLLSAAAYDPSDPQECLDNSLSSSNFQLQDIVTRKCDKYNKCSAFLAISHDQKAIVVAFRGSVDSDQVMQIFFQSLLEPKEKFLSGLDGEVQTYWKGAFNKLWPCMKDQVKFLVSSNPTYQVWVTGHSLGGAMASLASTWLGHYKIVSRKNLILYTFGMPRVGNLQYAYEHDLLVNNSWRVVNYNDAITQFPTLVSPTLITGNNPYHHGIEAYYTVIATSPYSKHKECHGKPYNEDITCSYKKVPDLSNFKFPLHKIYFSTPVGSFWETRCKDAKSSSRKKRDTTEIPREIFQYKNSSCTRYEYTKGSYILVSKHSKAFHIFFSKIILTFPLVLLYLGS